MTSTPRNRGKAFALIVPAVALAALGIYVAYAFADDPALPGLGPAGMGMNLMLVAVLLGAMAARRRLPTRVTRTILARGIVAAVVATLLLRAAAQTAPLFPHLQDIPSVTGVAPPPQYASAAARARLAVRAAILEQNLPGAAVAVGAGGAIVWVEGFGWRDVVTRAPVTPTTRFNVGTAASAVAPAVVARLGLTNTGAESAADWSPGHIAEPEEDFPGFTVIRHVIFEPIGLAPEQPLPGDRATFYVPRSDDDPRSGRRLMYMRDLACCAGRMASYSTASDMVRAGMANGVTINGELAGGMVTSLLTLRDRGVVVAVLSNIAHADTAALARKVASAWSSGLE